MNTQTIAVPNEKKEQTSPQLVLFNSRELAILHKARVNPDTMNRIKDLKHAFHGEVVEYNNSDF